MTLTLECFHSSVMWKRLTRTIKNKISSNMSRLYRQNSWQRGWQMIFPCSHYLPKPLFFAPSWRAYGPMGPMENAPWNVPVSNGPRYCPSETENGILLHCLGAEWQHVFCTLWDADNHATAITLLNQHFGGKKRSLMNVSCHACPSSHPLWICLHMEAV